MDSKDILIQESEVYENGYNNSAQCAILYSEIEFKKVHFNVNLTGGTLMSLDKKQQDYKFRLKNSKELYPAKVKLTQCKIEGIYYRRFTVDHKPYKPEIENLISQNQDQLVIDNCEFGLNELKPKDEN